LPLPGDDDPIIREHLLGRLPEKEAERLDELSIADDDFALRLTATENDLVDAYVRGELPAESRDRFRSFYLASPKRREKVRFAEALLAREKRVATGKAATETAVSGADQPDQTFSRWSERRLGLLQWVPRWGLAAAVLILLMAAASLLVQNRRLNTQITQVNAERAQLVQKQQELEKQLQEQRGASAGTMEGTQQSKGNGVQSKIQTVRVVAFVLSPAMRGAGSTATIAAPAGVKQIRIKLHLEANDFSGYRVTLKDPATDHAVWRSGETRAQTTGEGTTVSILLSTRLLKQQNYSFELNGITDRGTLEFISSYPFRFMVK
jgi:hypothetical protein